MPVTAQVKFEDQSVDAPLEVVYLLTIAAVIGAFVVFV